MKKHQDIVLLKRIKTYQNQLMDPNQKIHCPPQGLDTRLRNFTNPSPSLGCSRNFHQFHSCCFLPSAQRPTPIGKSANPTHLICLGCLVSCSWSPNHPPNYIKSGSACFGGNAFLAPFFFCFGPIISAQSSKSQSAGPTVKCGRIQVASKWKLLPTTSMVEIKR